MEKVIHQFRIFFPAIVGLLLLLSTPKYGLGENAGCQWCKRIGNLSEVINSHIADIEKKLKEHADCIDSHIPPNADPVYFTDDPILTNAHKMCEHLDPSGKYGGAEWLRAKSIIFWMKRAVDSDCFQVYLNDPKAEYSFTGTFETNIDGVKMDVGSRDYPSGRPALSRFTLDLYYEGKTREHVKTWQTLASNNKSSVQSRKMFANSTSPLLQDLPMAEILRNFERTPQSCEIMRPGGNEVLPGEIIDLGISRFQDEKGRKSREFNRIVVQAENGKILNGTAAGSPKQKAFKVGDGSVNIEYEAPEECGKDTIRVYNSCDISRQLPMSETGKREVIGQLNVDVACYDVTLSVTKKVIVTGQKEIEGTESDGKHYIYSRERRDEERANVIVGLEFDNVSDLWMFGELWAYYKPITVRLTSFSADFMEKKYSFGDWGSHGFETKVARTGNMPGGKKVQTPGVEMVALVYDRETKKPKRVVLVIHSIRYELDWTEKHNSRQWGKNPPPPVNEKKTTVRKKTFYMAPVGESSTDPATDMEIYPDFDITSGDGVNIFGGRGVNKYSYPCVSVSTLGTICDHDETYNWKLTRTKKKE